MFAEELKMWEVEKFPISVALVDPSEFTTSESGKGMCLFGETWGKRQIVLLGAKSLLRC